MREMKDEYIVTLLQIGQFSYCERSRCGRGRSVRRGRWGIISSLPEWQANNCTIPSRSSPNLFYYGWLGQLWNLHRLQLVIGKTIKGSRCRFPSPFKFLNEVSLTTIMPSPVMPFEGTRTLPEFDV